MSGDLHRLIEKVQYVSFDIFDTAVLRGVLAPTDLFGLVEKRYGARWGSLPFPFKPARVESERRARAAAWTREQRTEITLEEIYQLINEHFNVGEQTINRLKNLEIDTEAKICIPNPFILSVYHHCLRSEKMVLFASDMYLPLDLIHHILRLCGYTAFHKVYLSSSLGKTKSSGTLYEFLLRDLSCEPGEILHIGDHYDSDVVMAKRYGLATYYYEKCRDRALRCGEWGKRILVRIDGRSPVEESMYAAQVLKKFYSDGEASSQDFWYAFGYRYAGVLFLGFNLWLLEQAVRDGVETLYFLSRDGYIVKSVYDLLSPFYKQAPPSEYLYASRRALNIPGIVELDDSAMNFLVSGTSTLMVSQFLERIGLPPGEYEQLIREVGFSGKEAKVVTGHDYGMLQKLYRLLEGEIRKIAAEERALLFEYFGRTGLLGRRRIGLVDIGWHGTLQHSIERLLRLSGREAMVKGYYLGTFPEAIALKRTGQEMSAYLCELGRPKFSYRAIKLSVELFEFLHAAPHGSVVRFKRTEGGLEPVFDRNDFESEKIEKASAVQQGALDFIRDFLRHWQHMEGLTLARETALKPLYRVLSRPTYEEAIRLGDLEHAEGFGDVHVKRFIAKPPNLYECLANPYRFLQGYRKAFWRRGYLKRSFSLSKALRPS
jgi:predicted HAD superfamily hydrolase